MDMYSKDTVRSGTDIIQAVRAFAEESKLTSWAHLTTLLFLLTVSLILATLLPWWPFRLVASVVSGLLLIRGFILYHDYMHGAILRDSQLAGVIFFLLAICLVPFFRNPSKHWDSVLSIIVHFGLATVIGIFAGWQILLLSLLLPIWIASALCAYIFYAQHNFVGMHLLTEGEWTYSRAALETASYLKLGPVLQWFTGNIGYHHIHHLNPAIPFYCLCEAMVAVPELQNPNLTTLNPRDIIACLRLNLWDTAQGRMDTYHEAHTADTFT